MDKFKVAFKGIYLAFKHPSVMIQGILAIIALLFGIICKFSIGDMIIILLCIAMVIVSEVFNTAIEFLCNLYSLEYNEKIRTIKDISAGGVLISALISLLIAILLFLKYFGGVY